MPIRDMRVYLRVPVPRNSIHFHFHVVYTEPRASVHDASYAGYLRGINRTAHRDTVRTYLYVSTRATNACRHAEFAIILSITPGIGVNLRRLLAERWECTLIEMITTIRLTYRDAVLGTKSVWDNISPMEMHTFRSAYVSNLFTLPAREASYFNAR